MKANHIVNLKSKMDYADTHLQSKDFRLITEEKDGTTVYRITRDLIHDGTYESNGGEIVFNSDEASIDDLIELLLHYKKYE